MSATRWCLIPITSTLLMLCPRHGGVSFPSPLPYICYVSDTVVSQSHHPYLIYAMSATRWCHIPITPTLYMLCPRHGGLSFPSPLPYICYVRDTVVSHSHHPYLIYAMSATRWCLIPITPTLYMLCPRHGGVSFPSPLPYICYVRDTVVSHSHHPYLIYAMSATRWCLIPITPNIYMLCPRHGGLSFPSPLPYICYVRDTVVSHSHSPYANKHCNGVDIAKYLAELYSSYYVVASELRRQNNQNDVIIIVTIATEVQLANLPVQPKRIFVLVHWNFPKTIWKSWDPLCICCALYSPILNMSCLKHGGISIPRSLRQQGYWNLTVNLPSGFSPWSILTGGRYRRNSELYRYYYLSYLS